MGSTGYQSPRRRTRERGEKGEQRWTTTVGRAAGQGGGGRERGGEGEKRGGRGKEGGWTDSAACTWQSKEAINHEDNASSPLSEPRSLGVEGCLRRKRRAKEEEQAGVPRTSRRNTSGGGAGGERGRQATSRRSRQKVNRLPWLSLLSPSPID